MAYENIGLDSLGNYQDALKYYHKSLEIALQIGDKSGEIAYGNIGVPITILEIIKIFEI